MLNYSINMKCVTLSSVVESLLWVFAALASIPIPSKPKNIPKEKKSLKANSKINTSYHLHKPQHIALQEIVKGILQDEGK